MKTKMKFLITGLVVLILLVGITGVALAFNSGGKPADTGSDTITWTGQGASGDVLGTTECDANNTPYLLWILTVDGGSITNDTTTPTLHLGGTGSGDFQTSNPSDNSAAHFVTPYFTPDSSLTAYADINILTTGNGAWNLVISHGCAGGTTPPEATSPTVSKIAGGTYDNTYAWTIAKAVDKTVVKQFGGTATFNYTVTVGHDAGTISNAKVTGDITITNPDGATISITDELSDGTVCTVTGTTYECDLGNDLPDDAITNTVTITWSEQTLAGKHLAAGSDSFTSDPIVFTGNDIDESIDVSDSYAGTLGTVTVGDDNPTVFTYSRDILVPKWNCVSYDNTATFTTNDTETQGTASQTVKVCGPIHTGALTMGYWQNKNGQAQIKGAGGTPCNLTPFLRTYAPFQDLGTAASCSTVATYVTNVIKAANASGASMNAMLKAQMLATALDVYFYNIGGYQVDLTLICTDMTCTAFEDSSSVFGGTPKTISEMLAYAASQFDPVTKKWYGDIKATQELAKDAFDAINNEKVFAP
jgi:hypothetical protein